MQEGREYIKRLGFPEQRVSGGPCPDSRTASLEVCRNESGGGKRRKEAFAQRAVMEVRRTDK